MQYATNMEENYKYVWCVGWGGILACTCSCMWIYMYMQMCVLVEVRDQPLVFRRCLSCFFRQSLSLEPGALGLDLASWSAIPGIPSVPTSLILGLQMSKDPHIDSEVWIRSSCLQGEHFANSAIFPAWELQTYWRWECLASMRHIWDPSVSSVCVPESSGQLHQSWNTGACVWEMF